jgi:hypothetical protein
MTERIAFIHTYLNDDKRKDGSGIPIPDKTARVCIIAAAELYRRGQVDKIMLSSVPELSQPIVNRLLFLLHKSLKPEDIISTEQSKTTSSETQEIKRVMEEENIKHVTSICINPHKGRVEGNIRRVFGKEAEKVEVNTFDEVLIKLNKERYEKVVEGSKNWKEMVAISKQEILADKMLRTPLIGPFLVYDLWDYLPCKVPLQMWMLSKLGSSKEN